jgi:hypothetical protein
MSDNLRATVSTLAHSLVDGFLVALRGASLDEVLELAGAANPSGTRRPHAQATAARAGSSRSAKPARSSGGRLARRSPEQIAKALQEIVALVKTTKDGLRAEQIRQTLGMEAKEMPRTLREGLAKRVLTSRGEKRATT